MLVNDFHCNIIIKNKDVVRLECVTVTKLAGEQAKIVGWSKDSKPVYNDNIFYEIVKNGGTKQVLTVRNFTEKHAGIYECIAELNKKRKSCSVVVQREGMYFVCVCLCVSR